MALLTDTTGAWTNVEPVVAFVSATSAEWQSAYERNDDASFFQSPQWSEIWEAYFGDVYRPAPKRVTFTDGTRAILGVSVQRTRVGTERWHLSPAGTYGGWLWEEGGSPGHASALAKAIAGRSSVVWRSPPADAEIVCAAVPDATPDITHLIDLSRSVEDARARWRGSARRAAGRASRGGTRVRNATTHEDWMAYYALYEETLARWGRPSSMYERSLFVLFAELSSPDIRLWLAEAEGEPVAGAVVFTHRKHAVWWHAASSKRGPGATNLLQWELIDVLAAEGREIYDLNPSGGHAGVAAFKESLGATQASAPLVLRRNAVEKAISLLRRRPSRA